MSAIEKSVRNFIVENLLFGDESRAPGREDSLLELGVIDSTGVLELVEFVESRFGIKVKDPELIPDNLDSIGALVAFVQRKAGGV